MTSPRTQRIGREAAEWVVIFDGVEFNAQDVRAFRRWLAKSEDHRAAFELASRTWNQLDLLARLEAFDLPANDAAPVVNRRALVLGLGTGALAVGAGSYVALSGAAAEAFETGVGEQRAISLRDGTRVVLNADSRIEVRIDAHRREVRLVAGEALFSIANTGPQRPFSIKTKAGVVRAFAGEVLVKLFAGGMRVALMSDGARVSKRSWLGSSRPVIAGAQSEIVFDDDDVMIEPIAAEALSRRTLWRQGMLAFDDTPLAEAADDVARQTGVRFVFDDPALAALRVGGLIRANDLEGFLALLGENLAIRSSRRGDDIVLSRH